MISNPVKWPNGARCAVAIMELPTHWGCDDYPQYAHTPEIDYAVPVKAPQDAIRNYMDEFEAHYAHGGMWIACLSRPRPRVVYCASKGDVVSGQCVSPNGGAAMF